MNNSEYDDNRLLIFERDKRTNSIPAPIEQSKLVYSLGRYCDPLIAKKFHNLFSEVHREEVARLDPIANMLTYIFAELACNKTLKFYETDELSAPEILPELRIALESINFMQTLEDAISKAQIHGWAIIYPIVEMADEMNKTVRFEVYSELECPALQFIRRKDNSIVAYNIMYVPDVPIRGNVGLHQVDRYIFREQALLIVRGSYEQGFGRSAFIASWDAITKLREISHSDHYRQKVMPISVVPPDWSDSEIERYQYVLSKLDMMESVVVRAAEDAEGKIYTDLPRTSIDAMAGDVRRTSQVSSPQISNLNSEWARLCAVTRHTVGYIVGGGALSASMAAAGDDTNNDLKACIDEFNQYREPIKVAIQWIAQLFNIQLPNTFVIKGHWEWERDEKLFEQQMLGQMQMQMQIAGQESKDMQKNDKRANVQPNQYVPVNSQSGNVKTVFLEKDPHGTGQDMLHVEYNQPYGWYAYQDPAIPDMDRISDFIASQGGEAVWDLLRAGGHPQMPPGQSPKGMPKKHFGAGAVQPVPYAGRAHFANYWPESFSPGAIGGAQPVVPPQVPAPAQPQQQPQAPALGRQSQPQQQQTTTPIDEIFGTGTWWTVAKSYLKKIGSYLGKWAGFGSRTNDFEDEINPLEYLHPLLIEFGSISNAARANHIGKQTIYNRLAEIESCIRVNFVKLRGNSYSTKNPFRYFVNGKWRIEYQCPQSLKKIIGTKVPIINGHDQADPDTLEPLPDARIYGYQKINGFDDETGIELSEYEWDEKALEEDGLLDVLEKIRNNELPENSTGYKCSVHFDKDKRKYIQTDFEPKHLALVKLGNCSKPFCGVSPS